MSEVKKTKRQHFVPQFYLKQFADKNGKVDVIFKDGRCVPDSVSQVASRRYFYDSWLDKHIEGWGDQPVEKMLSQVEGLYADVFRRVNLRLLAGKPIDPSDKELLGRWLYIQFIRTSNMRKHFDPLPIGDLIIDSKVMQVYGISQAWSDDNTFFEHLMTKTWEISRITKGIKLPTSDSPVVVESNLKSTDEINKEMFTSEFLLDPAVSICFPINPQFLLKIRGASVGDKPVRYVKLDIEEQLNTMAAILSNAETQVFAVSGNQTSDIMQNFARHIHTNRDLMNEQRKALDERLGLK